MYGTLQKTLHYYKNLVPYMVDDLWPDVLCRDEACFWFKRGHIESYQENDL